MSCLEYQLKEYCDENERLKQENQSLKVKVSELHTEVSVKTMTTRDTDKLFYGSFTQLFFLDNPIVFEMKGIKKQRFE